MQGTHHAYYVEGPQSMLEILAIDARERFDFKAGHNPDAHVRHFEKFGIEESRWLTDAGSFKSAGGRALFVVGIASATTEAQQALLKLFEEPQEGTVYVLLVPHGTLLATLRSRMLPYPARLDEEAGTSSAKKFLSLAGKERSDFISKLLKDDEGTRERVRGFVNALEAELYVRPTRSNSPQARQALEDIAMVRTYLQDRSPSLKMLLEHLAVSLPSL